MESEQSRNFNERLSQWVANQGFWFQIRYSMTGSGTRGNTLFHLMRMGFRLLIFLMLVAAGTWVYLAKRTEYRPFNRELKAGIRSALSVAESKVDLGGYIRNQGRFEISHLRCEGGPETFFTALEARNIRYKMGLLDGVSGVWDPETISLSRLDLEIRAGSDDEESARMFAQALFKKSGKVLVNSMEVGDASVRWGYSETTRGSIEKSVLKMQRNGDRWRLDFKGGTFTQNWLRKLEIVNLVVICSPTGFVFEKAEFRRGLASVDLAGLKLLGGERPTITGVARIRRLSLETALPVAVRSFVEGSISGDFQVAGSTNSSAGIGFDGLVTLDGQDTVSLRERIHLLKALSVVDYVRNYYRVDFREGSFHLKTGGSGLEIKNLKLKAEDLFTLEGKLLVRLPTPEETKEAAAKAVGGGSAPLFQSQEEQADEIAARSGDDGFTLKRAAQETRRGREGGPATSAPQLDRLGLSAEMRRLEDQAADRLSKTLRYQGSFLITLLPDAFERAPKLTQQYPVDPKLGRIPMIVPVEGSLYEITLRQAEDIYQQRTR